MYIILVLSVFPTGTVVRVFHHLRELHISTRIACFFLLSSSWRSRSRPPRYESLRSHVVLVWSFCLCRFLLCGWHSRLRRRWARACPQKIEGDLQETAVDARAQRSEPDSRVGDSAATWRSTTRRHWRQQRGIRPHSKCEWGRVGTNVLFFLLLDGRFETSLQIRRCYKRKGKTVKGKPLQSRKLVNRLGFFNSCTLPTFFVIYLRTLWDFCR